MITPACWGMEPELSALWRSCFHEAPRPVRYFFYNAYHPRNCLVYSIGGRAAAMVHLLPARVALGGGAVPAHYIYAAATLPEFRGRGCMAALMAAAALEGAHRGHAFSLVLPAAPELYKLYEKSGYEALYHADIYDAPAFELEALAQGERPAKILATYEQLAALQNARALRTSGSALWGAFSFCYADGANRQYGGRLVAARRGEALAYALARRLSPQLCEVTELCATWETLPALAANLLAAFPALTYRMRQSPASPSFAGGAKAVFGMAKALGGETLGGFSPLASLGLTLD